MLEYRTPSCSNREFLCPGLQLSTDCRVVEPIRLRPEELLKFFDAGILLFAKTRLADRPGGAVFVFG